MMTLEEIMKAEGIVKKAYLFAKMNHAGQLYGGQPFEYHLMKVVDVLNRFYIDDDELRAAAWLHDVIEDTKATKNEIELMFGRTIADLVDAVTDGPGKNRSERKAPMYEKVRNTQSAILLKLADRIANVEEGISTKSKVRFMYLKEHKKFMEELFHGDKALALPTDPRSRIMWSYLNKLMKDIENE